MTNETINFLGKRYARSTFPGCIADIILEEQSGTELVETYNIIADNLEMKGVKKFSDKETAVRRTWNALKEFDHVVGQEAEAAEPAPAPKKEKKAAAPKPKAEGGASYSRSHFNFPLHDPKAIKNVRAASNRGILVKMLTNGATFDECVEATNWGEKRKGFTQEKARKACYEAIRLIHVYVGYGMKQDDNGVIRLIKE